MYLFAEIATGYLIIGFMTAYVLKFIRRKFEWSIMLTWPWTLFQAFMYWILA